MAFMFAVVDYVFPHYDVTRVTGVEVKRVDKDGPITKSNPADGPTRDVYLSIHKMMMVKSWCIVMKILVGVSRLL